MTELEQILKNTLVQLEQEIQTTLQTHSTELSARKQEAAIQAETLKILQAQIRQLQQEQQESAQHLQHLSDIHKNLEPLLSRLSVLLNAR